MATNGTNLINMSSWTVISTKACHREKQTGP